MRDAAIGRSSLRGRALTQVSRPRRGHRPPAWHREIRLQDWNGPAARMSDARAGQRRGPRSFSSLKEPDNGPRAFQILHRCLQRLCPRLRSLRERMPEGARCGSDGALHPARHRLRRNLQAGGRIYGPRKRASRRHMRGLRAHLRCLRARMRQASNGALPRMRKGLPPLRPGMSPHGFRAKPIAL